MALTLDDTDEAYTATRAALAPMIEQHGPEFVVGYLTSFIATHDLSAHLTAQMAAPAGRKVVDLTAALDAAVGQANTARLARIAREGEWT